ncbi:class I SAM-dependent methyltransferase [Maribacter sp. 2307ULW6-5]|uniref:class I SAM-dependent methyltransferase n=1 Tax=Maribacter sp. 2307ULW6-5 TaxID=3386275 RepID=UPI0039BC45CF
MAQIYDQNLWGGPKGSFYSGQGSHHPGLTVPYLERLTQFLNTFNPLPVVCDLGCGDFNVGRELVPFSSRYIGVDIVPMLIAHNKARFREPKLDFRCLDIAKDPLPKGNCALLRQVLQHLNNEEIHAILRKLSGFGHVVVTEHVPSGSFDPNVDIISGQGTRLRRGSGVVLTAPPFNFSVAHQEKWLSLPSPDGKGVVETVLYTMPKETP